MNLLQDHFTLQYLGPSFGGTKVAQRKTLSGSGRRRRVGGGGQGRPSPSLWWEVFFQHVGGLVQGSPWERLTWARKTPLPCSGESLQPRVAQAGDRNPGKRGFPNPIFVAVDVLAHVVMKNGVVPDMVCRIAVSRDADTLRRTDFERNLQALALLRRGEGFLCTSGIMEHLFLSRKGSKDPRVNTLDVRSPPFLG